MGDGFEDDTFRNLRKINLMNKLIHPSFFLFCALLFAAPSIISAQTDCAGVVDGLALVDECGDCQSAYVYNFITHSVTFVATEDEAVLGPNDILVLPDDPGNPYWNQACADVPGCTDVTACNFNYAATEDDGTCGVSDDCGDCQLPYCYNPVTHAVNYTAELDCGDIWVSGDMLSNPGMNPYWNSSCEIFGCTYPNACNYASNANSDDGNCEWDSCLIEGCTYYTALNFNAVATVDDGSCEFSNCEGDINHDGTIGTTDLLLFLSQFGSSCF